MSSPSNSPIKACPKRLAKLQLITARRQKELADPDGSNGPENYQKLLLEGCVVNPAFNEPDPPTMLLSENEPPQGTSQSAYINETINKRFERIHSLPNIASRYAKFPVGFNPGNANSSQLRRLGYWAKKAAENGEIGSIRAQRLDQEEETGRGEPDPSPGSSYKSSVYDTAMTQPCLHEVEEGGSGLVANKPQFTTEGIPALDTHE